MVRVPLETWEVAWAMAVGEGRTQANANRGDAAHYDRSRMEDDTRANIAAAVCEMAVAKYLNRYWSGSVWPVEKHAQFASLPDIEPDIEVRRVRDSRNPLCVRKRDARAGWKMGAPAPFAPETARLVAQRDLYPIREEVGAGAGKR